VLFDKMTTMYTIIIIWVPILLVHTKDPFRLSECITTTFVFYTTVIIIIIVLLLLLLYRCTGFTMATCTKGELYFITWNRRRIPIYTYKLDHIFPYFPIRLGNMRKRRSILYRREKMWFIFTLSGRWPNVEFFWENTVISVLTLKLAFF